MMPEQETFEIYVDIHNAGAERTLTVVKEGSTFDILLNGVHIAQMDYQTGFEEWHLRFGNLSSEDLKKVEAAIRNRYN